MRQMLLSVIILLALATNGNLLMSQIGGGGAIVQDWAIEQPKPDEIFSLTSNISAIGTTPIANPGNPPFHYILKLVRKDRQNFSDVTLQSLAGESRSRWGHTLNAPSAGWPAPVAGKEDVIQLCPQGQLDDVERTIQLQTP